MRRRARHLFKLCSAALLLLYGVAAGCAPEARFESRRTGPVAWGAPVDGLQVGLVAQTVRKVGDPSFPSEPGFFVLLVRNVGDHPVTFVELNRWCEATRARTRSLADLHVMPVDGGEARTLTNVLPQPDGAYVVRSLAPGAEYADEEFALNFLADILGPGCPAEAELVMTYNNDEPTVRRTTFDRGPAAVTVDRVWTGAIRTGPLKVRFHHQ